MLYLHIPYTFNLYKDATLTSPLRKTGISSTHQQAQCLGFPLVLLSKARKPKHNVANAGTYTNIRYLLFKPAVVTPRTKNLPMLCYPSPFPLKKWAYEINPALQSAIVSTNNNMGESDTRFRFQKQTLEEKYATCFWCVYVTTATCYDYIQSTVD